MQDHDPVEVSRAWAARIESDERLRFDILRSVYEVAAADTGVEINAARFAGVLAVPLERIFAVVEFLSREGYLVYRGAGPRIALTQRGVEYVQGDSGRRGTLRD